MQLISLTRHRSAAGPSVSDDDAAAVSSVSLECCCRACCSSLAASCWLLVDVGVAPAVPNPVETLYTRPTRKCRRDEAVHSEVMNFIVVDFMIAVVGSFMAVAAGSQ